MSKVEQARGVLNGLGWDSPNNLHSCIAVPKDMKIAPFFKIPPYHFEGSFPLNSISSSGALVDSNNNTASFADDGDSKHQEILTAVMHMSNFISAEPASRQLKRYFYIVSLYLLSYLALLLTYYFF